MMNQTLLQKREKLKAAILRKYPTLYAFWKAHKDQLSKSVIMQIFAGKYPGNTERQLNRIWATFYNEQSTTFLTETLIVQALQEVACSACGKKKKVKNCRVCQNTWKKQAEAILKLDDYSNMERTQ